MASFREFLELLEKEGELKTMEGEADWNLEASAICAMAQRAGGPAVLFTNVKGYPRRKIVGSLFTGPGFLYWPQVPRLMHGRIALGLGLDKGIHYEELQDTILERKKGLIRPLEISSGPCQEEIIKSKDVNLYDYPIPYLHDKDGGRYLTSAVVIAMDPDSGLLNFSVHRAMLAGSNLLVHGAVPRSTSLSPVELAVRKAARRHEPLPFAIAIGVPPPVLMTAYFSLLPPETDKYAVAGGLGAAPIPLVKAQLSDLLVPADSEMVLEGHVYPGETMEEGPFAEISAYTPKVNGFVYHVELISQQKDPIIPFIAEGANPSDSMCLVSTLHSSELFELLRGSIMALVDWVTIPVECKLVVAVVGMGKQSASGLPSMVWRSIYSISPYIRQVWLVDSDTDAQQFAYHVNDRQQKVDYEKGIWISALGRTAGLTENHDFDTNITSTMALDATWRPDRPHDTKAIRVGFEFCLPEPVQKRVLELWKKWGVKPEPLVIKKRR